jgi:hypothetical protein
MACQRETILATSHSEVLLYNKKTNGNPSIRTSPKLCAGQSKGACLGNRPAAHKSLWKRKNDHTVPLRWIGCDNLMAVSNKTWQVLPSRTPLEIVAEFRSMLKETSSKRRPIRIMPTNACSDGKGPRREHPIASDCLHPLKKSSRITSYHFCVANIQIEICRLMGLRRLL